MRRTCIDCGILIHVSQRRCRKHQAVWEAKRVARRGNLYGRAHRGRAGETIDEQGWCSICGATGDLVADHIVPRDPDSPLRTLCRSCNSTRANLMRYRGGRALA